MSLDPSASLATREKSQAALSSVVAAVGLTTFKIIVGTFTGSLGILAEAAHSGLDLVAALVTFLAVRVAVSRRMSNTTMAMGRLKTFPRCLRHYYYWVHVSGSSMKPTSGYLFTLSKLK